MNRETIHLILSLQLILSFVKQSEQVSIEEDLTITSDQKKILDIFRDNVVTQLTKDYQNSDISLIRWLRANDFDLKRAQEMLEEDLRWRKENNMDTIFEEDWSDFQTEYPLYLSGHDKEGRPIMIMNIAEWDLRRAVISGQRKQLVRWWIGAWEQMALKVRDLQAENKNVSQSVLIIDIKNFALQQGCIQCLPFFTTLLSSYQNHYPGTVHELVIVNVSSFFLALVNGIRPAAQQEITKILKMYGSRSEWEPMLLKSIKPDQLPKSLGGTISY